MESRGKGGTWVNFCWVCAAGLSEPLTRYSLFCGQLQTPTWSLSVYASTLKILLTRWIDTFVKLNVEHVLYSHFCTTVILYFNTQNPYLPEYSLPQIPKICDPILVTLLKMQPHFSQPSRENATPSSGTSLKAYSLLESTPPPPPGSGVSRMLAQSWNIDYVPDICFQASRTENCCFWSWNYTSLYAHRTSARCCRPYTYKTNTSGELLPFKSDGDPRRTF